MPGSAPVGYQRAANRAVVTAPVVWQVAETVGLSPRRSTSVSGGCREWRSGPPGRHGRLRSARPAGVPMSDARDAGSAVEAGPRSQRKNETASWPCRATSRRNAAPIRPARAVQGHQPGRSAGCATDVDAAALRGPRLSGSRPGGRPADWVHAVFRRKRPWGLLVHGRRVACVPSARLTAKVLPRLVRRVERLRSWTRIAVVRPPAREPKTSGHEDLADTSLAATVRIPGRDLGSSLARRQFAQPAQAETARTAERP
jgi:hypothetical protein